MREAPCDFCVFRVTAPFAPCQKGLDSWAVKTRFIFLPSPRNVFSVCSKFRRERDERKSVVMSNSVSSLFNSLLQVDERLEPIQLDLPF